VLPLLIRHVGSDNYVACTYAAITIERVLAIRQGVQILFVSSSFPICVEPDVDKCSITQADIQEFAPNILNIILAKIESAGSPEKMAENDHLVKCPYLNYSQFKLFSMAMC
jgi:exportin-2 (importin alpha re-exporter)